MQNGGQRNSQGRDMSQRIEVCRAGSIAHPQPFLTCGFEAGIVTLALCTQGVCPLEWHNAVGRAIREPGLRFMPELVKNLLK